MLKSSLWFPRVQWQTFQIQQLCIHTQCSVILVCHWWYKFFVHWWMKGIHFASFYFRVWDLTRENKNPAKISTYTVPSKVLRLVVATAVLRKWDPGSRLEESGRVISGKNLVNFWLKSCWPMFITEWNALLKYVTWSVKTRQMLQKKILSF